MPPPSRTRITLNVVVSFLLQKVFSFESCTDHYTHQGSSVYVKLGYCVYYCCYSFKQDQKYCCDEVEFRNKEQLQDPWLNSHAYAIFAPVSFSLVVVVGIVILCCYTKMLTCDTDHTIKSRSKETDNDIILMEAQMVEMTHCHKQENAPTLAEPPPHHYKLDSVKIKQETGQQQTENGFQHFGSSSESSGTGSPLRHNIVGVGSSSRHSIVCTESPARRHSVFGTGRPTHHSILGTASQARRHSVFGTGSPARNSLVGTGSPSRNSLVGTGSPARNNLVGTGSPARNSLVGTGSPARNSLVGTGSPARNSLVTCSSLTTDSGPPTVG